MYMVAEVKGDGIGYKVCSSGYKSLKKAIWDYRLRKEGRENLCVIQVLKWGGYALVVHKDK